MFVFTVGPPLLKIPITGQLTLSTAGAVVGTIRNDRPRVGTKHDCRSLSSERRLLNGANFRGERPHQVICDVIAGPGENLSMPYLINQFAHQFNLFSNHNGPSATMQGGLRQRNGSISMEERYLF